MSAVRRLNSAQVLARLARGEALERADYSRTHFPDGARPGAGVLARLIRDGSVKEAAPNIGAVYTLAAAEPVPAQPHPHQGGDLEN